MSGAGAIAVPLTRRQERALAALLTQPTLAQAARQAGCDERTIRRYLQDAAFLAAYRDGQRQQWQEALALLTQGAVGAAATLRTITIDPAQPGHTRVRAGIALLQMVHEQLNLAALDERLAALEAALAAKQDMPHAPHTR
jgi:hypothetical protein